jgi:hypothetical protein
VVVGAVVVSVAAAAAAARKASVAELGGGPKIDRGDNSGGGSDCNQTRRVCSVREKQGCACSIDHSIRYQREGGMQGGSKWWFWLLYSSSTSCPWSGLDVRCGACPSQHIAGHANTYGRHAHVLGKQVREVPMECNDES